MNKCSKKPVGVKHPVMYNVYNLCQMAFENKLSFFKAEMLRKCDLGRSLKSHPIRETPNQVWLRNYLKWSKIAHARNNKITQCKFQTVILVNWNSTTLSIVTFVTVWFIWVLNYAWQTFRREHLEEVRKRRRLEMIYIYLSFLKRQDWKKRYWMKYKSFFEVGSGTA